MASTMKEFIHLRISLEEIVEATNNFADKNIIGKGGFGNVYRGKLMHSGKLIKISARRLDRKSGQGDVEFWTEVSMLSSLTHENIVSMIGFCDEKDEKIIVNRYYRKGSLLMHLSNPILRWSKRVCIAAAVARAIDYLHYEVSPNYVIHGNINSSTILLNGNWEPKLSGFEFSIKHSQERRNEVILSKAIGTNGYIDPEIYKTGGVTHKSDIYSFGVVLLELLCGRRANEGDTLLVPLARSHYKSRTLPNIIHPGLRNQIHRRSYKVFTVLAFNCLDSKRSERWNAHTLGASLSVSCGKENVDGTSGLSMYKKDDAGERSGSGLPTDGEKSASGLPTYEEDDRGEHSVHEGTSGLPMNVKDDTGERSASGLPIDGEKSASRLPSDEEDDRVEHSVHEGTSGLSMDENDDTSERSASGLPTDGEKSASGLPTDEKLTNFEDLRIPRENLRLSDLYSSMGYLSRLPGENKHEASKGHYYVTRVTTVGTSSREIEILRRCRHPNIESILGFCDEGSNMILFFEYTEGTNSLSDNVITNIWTRSGKKCSTWEKCLKIFVDVARGLNYLQNEMGDRKMVIHRDINSNNIMVDWDGRAKIIGFKNSVFFPMNQDDDALHHDAIVGETYYIDPEYAKTGKLKPESDVFSFGVLMFEIFYGSPVSDIVSYEGRNGEGIAQLVRRWFKEGIIKEKMASKFRKENYENIKVITKGCNKDYVDTFLDIVCKCLVEAQDQRPQIKVVLKELEKALSFQGTPGLSMYENDDTDEWIDSDSDLSTDGEKSASGLPIDEKDDRGEHNVQEGTSSLSMDEKDDPGERSDSDLPTDGEKSALGLPIDEKLTNLEDLRIPREDLKVLFGNSGFLYRLPGEDKHEPSKGLYEVKIVTTEGTSSSREIEILRRCRHPNIESILGFCDEGSNRILVYEYTNGTNSLSDNLITDICSTWEKCLKIFVDVAHGLNYLQNEMGDQKTVIHRDIHSDNIMVDQNGRAKIIGFRNAVFFPMNQDDDSLQHDAIVGETYYIDPEYAKTGKLKPESDVFSFGVLMFEIFYGSPVCDIVSYKGRKGEGIAQLVRRWFKDGIIKEKLAYKFRRENYENKKIITKGCNEGSVDTFLDIVCKCLVEAQDQRPQIKVVLKELEKTLSFQLEKDPLWISFEDIKSATQDFSPNNYVGEGGFGKVFKGKLAHKHGNGHYNIVAKLDKSHGQGEKQYYNELQILYEYKHENIIALLGYSNETNEKFIVYEEASKGSLDRYLNDANLTWRNRLKICIDVATGLDFIHGGDGGQEVVVHRDIKSANILLFDNWNAKVGDFGLSLISTINDEAEFTIDHACGTTDYLDPLYSKSGLLTVKSDVYSFGIVLLEILYGSAIYSIPKQEKESLLNFIKHDFDNSKQYEVVFKAIRKEIKPKSLTTFLKIVQSCLAEDREKRPT